MASKRKTLSLKEKVDIIGVADTEKLSVRSLASRFKVGKTQISELLRKKEEILKLWITNSNENSKHIKVRKTETSAIDSIVFDWFCATRAKNIPMSGPLLQEKALEASIELGIDNFKASNGWLEKFRTRHNISFKAICGEAKSVDANEVTDWLIRLKTLLKGYKEENIFNADETGLFFRVLPNKTMCLKNETCSGGKISKERLTVMLCSNMKGEFETPLVIGKAQKPRCFKNIDLKKLSVTWRANKKAWMTTEIMTEWLSSFDAKMKKERRKVLLFLDNATSHPDLKFKNVQLVFLPPNTTSVCQPLDLGVIKNFKCFYRKVFLRHIISKMSACNSSDELAKSVNVLDAVSWISSAVSSIKEQTVQKCFCKAGFDFATKVTPQSGTNQTDESVLDTEIIELIKEIESTANPDDFITIDDQLQTETTGDLKDCISLHREEMELNEDEEDCTETNNESCEIRDFTSAIRYAEQLQNFFVNKGDSEGLKLITGVKIHVEKQACDGKKNIKHC